MHAVVTTFKMDPARFDLQMKVLNEQMLPGARQAPGFLGAYWTRDTASVNGVAMLFFDSLESAQAMASFIQGAAAAQAEIGVTTETLTVSEVLAYAATP